MRLNKLYVSREVTERLKILQARTGLTPNILCRIGFCLSLRESLPPNPEIYQQDGKEFNRFTLTGEYDELFVVLLKQSCVKYNLSYQRGINEQFRAHINRGVLILDKLAKNLHDLAILSTRLNIQNP
ncbi:DNA sulfur modification protein DndE [bacterium]|nr:DNA sulfur modification protein DndE [bacterium]